MASSNKPGVPAEGYTANEEVQYESQIGHLRHITGARRRVNLGLASSRTSLLLDDSFQHQSGEAMYNALRSKRASMLTTKQAPGAHSEPTPLSRRYLLKRTAGLALASGLTRAEGLFRPTELNHVFVRARDPEKSRAFYEKLFGPPKRRLTSGAVLFEFGSSEVGIGAIPNRPIGIDHFCVSVEDFSIETVAAKLRGRQLTPEKLYAADELYFRDPDGILVQLAAPKYHNPRALAIEPSSNVAQPLFSPLSLDHLALRVSNLERATAFYEALFGPSRRQPDRPLAGIRTMSGQVIGWGTDGVSAIGVDHFCIAIVGYEPDAVSRKLQQNGIASERLYRPDQVFVRDPDGILVQLAGPGRRIPGRRVGE